MIENISIIIVDDHEIVRDGIRALMLGHPKIRVMADVPNAMYLFQALKQDSPDLILLDIALPGTSGIEICKIIQKEYPHIRVLMLSANTQENYILSSVKAGARGFLPKDCSKKELFEGIIAVHRGNLYFGRNITTAVFQSFARQIQQTPQEDLFPLSDREMEVLLGFARGMSYKEIADELSVSARTIESHKKSIFEKLNFQNNVDLVKYAIREGLIPLN